MKLCPQAVRGVILTSDLLHAGAPILFAPHQQAERRGSRAVPQTEQAHEARQLAAPTGLSPDPCLP